MAGRRNIPDPRANLPDRIYPQKERAHPNYDPEIAAQIMKLASYGLSVNQVVTLTRVKKAEIYSTYSEAYEQGRAIGLGGVSRNLFKIATTGSDGAAVSAGAFIMQFQGGWRKDVPEEAPDATNELAAEVEDAKNTLDAKLAAYLKTA